MKNIIRFTVLMLLFSLINKAQILNNISFKVGYVSSNVSHSIDGSDVDNFSDCRSGFLINLSKEFTLSDIISLAPSVQFNQKGFNENWKQTNMSGIVKEGTANTRLDYLSILLCAKVKYKNPILTPYLSAGPRLDFLINKDNGIIDLTSGSIQSVWADNFSKWSYGFCIIAGIEYCLTKDLNIIFEVSYSPDISDLLRESNFADYMKMRNGSFDIGIGAII